MSGNATAVKTDKRVLRTRDTLGDALMELLQEKPFDDITVQEVLDRAGVGRSTFYAHYRDKDDLFLSDVEDFFQMMSGLLTRHKVRLNAWHPWRNSLHIYRMRARLWRRLCHPARWEMWKSWGAGLLRGRLKIGCGWQVWRWSPRSWRCRLRCLRRGCLRCCDGGWTTVCAKRRWRWTRCFIAWCGTAWVKRGDLSARGRARASDSGCKDAECG